MQFGDWSSDVCSSDLIPEFEDFLQPPSCSKILKNLPDSGFIAIINVHKDSCDALALISNLDKPLHIPLHHFTYEKATNLRNQLNVFLRAANIRMRGIRATCPVGNNDGSDIIKNILHQLWILVVKPILDGLGFSVSIIGIPNFSAINFSQRNLHPICHVSGGVQQGLSHFFQYMQLEYMPHLHQKLDPLYLILQSHPTFPM